jgi:hypothetical protein
MPAMAASVRQPMDIDDLDHFILDCNLKTQQIQFLQSLRHTPNERLAARFNNLITPWQGVTDPYGRRQQRAIGNNEYNWIINQHIWTLNNQC